MGTQSPGTGSSPSLREFITSNMSSMRIKLMSIGIQESANFAFLAIQKIKKSYRIQS